VFDPAKHREVSPIALDSSSILIAGNGSVNVAPLGTALPTDSSTALNAAFLNLGYVSEDGATISDSKTKEPVRAWQSFYAIKNVVTESDLRISFVLLQWDAATVPLAFGGGVIAETAPGSGEWRYTPPPPEQIDERALVLEWQFDAATFRLVTPRMQVAEGIETQLARASTAQLPIVLTAMGTEGVDAYTIYTDHPSWATTP